MALGVNARAGAFLDGVAVAAQDLRLQEHSAHLTGASPSGTTGIAARPGVRPGLGSPLLVQASSGMNITVNAGVAHVQGTASANAGMYTACLDATATITVATSDPTNPRIDNVIAQVTDVGTSSSTTVLTLQTGTPAPSPVAPALPANSLLLATVAVAANTSTIVAGNITDKRVYTVAAGGIVPMDTSGGLTGQAGLYAHDTVTGRLRASDGSGNARQPKINAFAAVSNTVASATALTSGYTNMVSVTVTVDGATEVMIFCSWPAIVPASGVAVGDYLETVPTIDGGAVGNVNITRMDSTSLNVADGGCIFGWTTPGAGSHTFALSASAIGHNFTIQNPYIRVAPSLQQ